jgi:hypothetical protein
MLLCAAARACKAWREAVQQCSPCNTEVLIDLGNSNPTSKALSAMHQDALGVCILIYRAYQVLSRQTFVVLCVLFCQMMQLVRLVNT